ncbi:B12-binding domain-containing radical SAM protein [Salinispira pacifica]|uniref:Fe-S oxidoreductase n=1 Tax=Salinispira pacifica TaxID=1307761 RepID=V5WIJ5_9SPIO|nr:B12-binding domain-containing radical SAM protein [Salinispira pacifica]AHC15647.1 Fe-S oxidoreductase [Salinispira pacifica]
MAAETLKTYYLHGSTPVSSELDILTADFSTSDSPEMAAASILARKPGSVGFSMYIWNRSFCLETAEIIKNRAPSVILYTGGAEVTADPESLDRESVIDYILPGEGELPFRILMDYIKSLHSPHTKNREEKPARLLSRSNIHDIRTLPSPYLEGNGMTENGGEPRRVLLWELSRGCPYNCAFCAESRGIAGVRYISMERIEAELKLFERQGVEQIFVLDPTFNTGHDRAIEILGLIAVHAPSIHFTFEVRAELLNVEQAEAFSKIRCSLQIGLQSADSDVLRYVNRSIRPDMFMEKIGHLNEYGVIFGLDLIYGLPADTLQGFQRSLDFALSCLPNHLDIFRLSVFPGTELHEKADSLGLIRQPSPPYAVLGTDDFSEQELSRAEELAAAANRFYNQGAAVAWFMPVCDALEMRPSEFLGFAADIHEENGAAIQTGDGFHPDPLMHWQLEVLRLAFRKHKKKRYGKVAADLCRYHHYYARALKEADLAEDAGNPEAQISRGAVLRRSSQLYLADFNYDVNLYTEPGMFSLEDFVREYDPEPSFAMIFAATGEIVTLALEEPYYVLLTKINGSDTLKTLLEQTGLSFDDVEDLLVFLHSNGLMHVC